MIVQSRKWLLEKREPSSADHTHSGGRSPGEPALLIQNLVRGYQHTQIIYVAAKLGLADHLKDGPLTVTELAELTGSHIASLYRLLRALAAVGVFAEEQNLRFRLTPAAELLRSGVPGSMRARAEVAGESWMWRPWGDLLHSIKTGQTAFNHLYGKGTFDWFSENAEAARLFDDFIAESTALSIEEVIAAYDWPGAGTVVDIGGGAGVLLTAILQHRRNARGILFDRKHVIGAARKKLDASISRRCKLVSGDLFKTAPRGGDLYILKSVLHDWNDDQAQVILKTCRRAMANKARLLVVEEIIRPPGQPCEAKLSDLNMLVRTGGRNRTEAEYRHLMAAGGFSVTGIRQAGSRFSLMEATPCD